MENKQATIYSNIEWFFHICLLLQQKTGKEPDTKLMFTPRGNLIGIIYTDK